MRTLGESELEFNTEALRNGDAFDRQELSRALLADYNPPIGRFLSRETWSNNGDVTVVLFFVRIAAKRDL